MATSTKNTSPSFATEVQSMMKGLSNSVPSSLKSMPVGGNTMTIAQVIGAFQTILEMLNAVVAAKSAYTAAVAARKTGILAARTFYENVVTNLKQTFGATNQAELALFGIAAPKAHAKPSSEAKAIAHAKALATRAARGTMGKKQKAAITTTPDATIQITAPNGQVLSTSSAAVVASSTTVAPAAAAPAAAPATPVAHS